jgi:lysozyme
VRSRRRRIAVGLAGAIVLAGVLGGAFVLTYRPDRARFPIRGIDVSHHQGEIDWRRVAGDGVAFAYIKASEGGDYRDPNFDSNRTGAERAGIKAGAYHFFTLCRPGRDQAENFLAAVGGQRSLLPPTVDLEFGGNCARRPDPEELARELGTFLDAVEKASAQSAIFYATDDFRDAYGSALPERRMWRRSLFMHPGDDRWIIWQYHNAGGVAGVSGPVDLDVFHGSEAEFSNFANEAVSGPQAGQNQSRHPA